MAYSVRILKDSVGPNGVRITTWELTYPRFVHAELMTHRLFSRNSASSRAIPTKKLMRQIRKDPAMPVWWGKNQSGMQAREALTGWRLTLVKRLWLSARWGALFVAWLLGVLGFHRQIANRILEPWMFITVIVTATEFDNWFKLRCHPDAQPEIGWVAVEMKRQYESGLPQQLQAGDWHLPLAWDDEIDLIHPSKAQLNPRAQSIYVGDGKCETFDFCKISAGRCARVSYLTHDGKRDHKEDVNLADRLMQSGHWSPFEHVAQALGYHSDKTWSGNLRGWLQFRETVDTTFTKVGRI